MKRSTLGLALASTMIAIAPLAPASAHGHGGWGHHEWGIFGLGAAVVAGTAAVLSAPFYAAASVAEPAPYYPPERVAYAEPRYYAPPPQAYYAQPAPVYYEPTPVYYGRPYGRRYYY